MKRDFLENLGIDKDMIDKIMEEHGKSVEAGKTKIAEFEQGMSSLVEQLKERDSQLEELAKFKGNTEELQAEVEKLKLVNQEADKAHEAEIKAIKLNNAVESALVLANTRNLKATKALLDMGKISINDTGEVIGINEQIEKLIKSEESKFLFGEGSFKGAPPPLGSDKDPFKKEPGKMTYEEYQKAFEEGKI